MSNRITTLCFSLAASTLFASTSFAGDVRRVGSEYESGEHNQNYSELNKRTKSNAAQVKKQKNSLNKAIKKLQQRNKSTSNRIDALGLAFDTDLPALLSEISGLKSDVSALATSAGLLVDRITSAEADVSNIQDRLDLGNVKAIVAFDGDFDNPRGFSNIGRRPRVSIDPVSLEFIVNFGVPMKDRFYTITNMLDKQVRAVNRVRGEEIRLKFTDDTGGSFFADWQLIVY